MTEINADAVIDAVAKRAGDVDHELRSSMRAIWEGVASDLKPEEACVVIWAINPGAVIGTSSHRQALARLARAMYPADAPGRAVSRLRRVMARPSVRAVIDAMRTEEALFAVSQRGKIRGMLAEMSMSSAPSDSEPKDIVAHNRVRLAAMQQWVKLDGLDAPPPIAETADAEPAERRKKLLDKVKALIP